MLHAKIALIDTTGTIQAHHLQHTAEAVQLQVNRDFGPIWGGITATITTMHKGTHVPFGVWPVYVVPKLAAGEGGYHWDRNNQPYAEILSGAGWTVDFSHETLEMLVDPSGNRTQLAPIMELQGDQQVLGAADENYLVEVCDPVEAGGYMINKVPVSDFITPAFYQAGTQNLRYSFTGDLTAPLTVLDGGYITWFDDDGNATQIQWIDGPEPQIVHLGQATGAKSLKEWVDSHTGGLKRARAKNSVVKRAHETGLSLA